MGDPVAVLMVFVFGMLAGGVVIWALTKQHVADVDRALAAFDHDGDGSPGGSLPKSRRRPF